MSDNCECCGTKDNVTVEPCPYAHEILDDDTPVPLCGECRQERAEDI